MTGSTPLNPTLKMALDFAGGPQAREAGMSPRGLARLSSLFDAWMTTGDRRCAGQLVVLRRGRVAFDRSINAEPSTPFFAFSMSKAFTGACIHRLLEDGRLEWDAPVAEFWPEFGCKGKQTATIRHVFLHQTGISNAFLLRQAVLWPNWNLITRAVAQTPAAYPPGTKTHYSMVNYGFIFGKVVEAVTGLTFPDYLRQAVLDPLGLAHTWLPVPPDELRRSPAVITAAPAMRLYATGVNLPQIRRAIAPAATLHTTARDLAVFYQAFLNGGVLAGKRILQPETAEAATRQGAVEEKSGTLWAYGFHLGSGSHKSELSGMGRGSTERTFGHFGMGTCMAWADPDAELVVAFNTNLMLDEANGDCNRRLASLSNAIWDAIQ